MKLIYLNSVLKCDSFDVAIDIKIQFFRVLVSIEPGRSLLQFVTTNCLIVVGELLIPLGANSIADLENQRVNFYDYVNKCINRNLDFISEPLEDTKFMFNHDFNDLGC